MANSSQIVINLQDSQARVNELRRVLDKANLVTDSEKMLEVFDGVKASLLEVLDFMDQIINFDPAQVKKNYAQAQSVQSLANQIQKNLFEGRMKINELPDDVDNLLTEKTLEHVSELITSFLELQDLYETQMQDDHLSFERLAVPEVELLFNPVAFIGLERTNRLNVLTVFRDFLVLDSISPGFERASESYKTHVEKYFPIFTNLAKTLTDKVSLIANDISEFDTVLIDAQQSPYLEAFREQVSSLLHTDFNLTELIKATKDDTAYFRLMGQIFNKAFNDDSLSMLDVTKTLLTLQALRIKELEKTNSLADLQLLNDEKMLGFNDKRSARDAKQFSYVMAVAHEDINRIELLPVSFATQKQSNNPLVIARRALSRDSNLKIVIAQLKKEFEAQETKARSEFDRFYDENKILFVKFDIKPEDIFALRTCPDNTLLREMLEKITTKTKKDSSICYRQAAKFAYVLAEVFAKEPKLDISSKFKSNNLNTISFDNSLLRIFRLILDNQNNLPKNPPEDHK